MDTAYIEIIKVDIILFTLLLKYTYTIIYYTTYIINYYICIYRIRIKSLTNLIIIYNFFIFIYFITLNKLLKYKINMEKNL